MTSDEIISLLRSTGAIVDGHFATPAGPHTSMVVRTVKATQFAPYNRRLCYEIVRHFLELDVHVVIAAHVAAVPMAVEIGRQLEARAIFVNPASDPAELFRGFELHEGERAVAVDDVMWQDGQIDAVAALVRRANARMIGIGSLVDARAARERRTVKDVAAVQMRLPLYRPAACPLCVAGAPLVEID